MGSACFERMFCLTLDRFGIWAGGVEAAHDSEG